MAHRRLNFHRIRHYESSNEQKPHKNFEWREKWWDISIVSKNKKKEEKRGVLFPFRRVNSIPPPTILTYRSPEGGGEGGSGPVIRAEIYAVALQHSATKHRGRRRGRNKRFQGNSGRCAGIIGPPRLVVLFQVSSIRLISPTTSTSRYSTSVSLLRCVLHSISLLDISSSSRNLPIVPVLIISRRGSTPIEQLFVFREAWTRKMNTTKRWIESFSLQLSLQLSLLALNLLIVNCYFLCLPLISSLCN